jgi:hypothetical protein
LAVTRERIQRSGRAGGHRDQLVLAAFYHVFLKF